MTLTHPTFSRMQKHYYGKAPSWLSLVICGKKEIKEYLQKRQRPTQNFLTMLFTKLYFGVKYLIFLIPIVIPLSLQIGKVFCKHRGLYIPSCKFQSSMKLSLIKRNK